MKERGEKNNEGSGMLGRIRETARKKKKVVDNVCEEFRDEKERQQRRNREEKKIKSREWKKESHKGNRPEDKT